MGRPSARGGSAARSIAMQIAAAFMFAAFAPDIFAQGLPLGDIRLPKGFTIELVARAPGAREMTFGDRGTLFVGSVRGDVYAITFDPARSDGTAAVRTIASGLRQPVGVAFRDGALYVSAVSTILRFDDIERHLDRRPKGVVVRTASGSMVITGGSSTPSGRTASCTCPWARRATCARRIATVTPPSCA